jgi:DeoR family transcriptional regulator, suf operon transcriptional repressor
MTAPSPSASASGAAGRPLGLKGPRADVVMELKRAGGLTAKQVAERLALSLNAVRHHVKELEASGLVGYEREHRGVGAPVFVYRLTAAGEALFPRRYEDAVGRLLDHVVASEGRNAAVRVLESKYRDMAAELLPALADAPPAERMAVVARALAAEGYMPEVQNGDGGAHRLVEHNCPIQQVAERFPEVCEAEARFLAEVLEAQVTREAHIASGCSACEYHVQPVALGRVPSRPAADVEETR